MTFGNVAYTADEPETGEDAVAATVTVSLNRNADRQLTIPITTDPSSGDFDLSGLTNNSVTILPGSQTATFTISARDDGNFDDDMVTLSFDEANLPEDVAAVMVPGVDDDDMPIQMIRTATVTLKDTDRNSVTVMFASAKYTATENGATATVTVTATPAPNREIEIPIKTNPEKGDFSLAAAMVTIQSGATTGTVVVTAAKDTDLSDETVTLSFGDLPLDVKAGSRKTTAVTLKDDKDAKMTVSFGAATYSFKEEATGKVTVKLSGKTDTELSIPITFTDHMVDDNIQASGVNGPGTVTIAADKDSATFDVIQPNDGNFDNEEVKFAIGDLTDAALAGVVKGTPAETTVTLVDNDRTALTAFFGGSTYSAMEGGEGATVTVLLTADPTRPMVEIPIVTTPKTGAFQLVDDAEMPMALTDNKLVFAAGENIKMFRVMATDDENVTNDMVQLSFGDLPPDVKAGSPSSATVTLVDDLESKWAVSFGTTSYTADEGGEAVTVTVLLSQRAIHKLEIPIEPDPTGGDFFSLSTRIAVFNPGERSFTFTVTPEHDVNKDDDEITLSFGPLPEEVLEGSQTEAKVTLVDDDLDALQVSFGEASYTATEEGTAATVEVSLNQAADRQVVIKVATTPAEGDFTLSAEELVFYEGTTSQTVTVTASADDDVSDDSVTLRFTDLPKGVSAGSQATTTVRLADDDVTPLTVSFASATYSATEGGSDGADEVTVTVNLSPAADREVTIPINATAGSRELSASQVVIAKDGRSGTFTVTAQDDSDVSDESIKLTFGSLPPKVKKGTLAESTVTIVDDDRAELTVNYELASYTAVEEDASNGNDAEVTVTVSPAADRTIIIPITTSPASGDFELDITEVEIPIGSTQGFVFVTAKDDDDTSDETVTLSFGDLPVDVTGGSQRTTSVTLQDDGRRALTVAFGAATYTATEAADDDADAAEVTVMVRLNQASDRTLTIPLTNGDDGRNNLFNVTCDCDYSQWRSERVVHNHRHSRW